MSITVNPNALPDALREGAKRLLRAAIEFQSEHMRRLGIHNPPPYKASSKEGEYPKQRTGFGQKGVVIAPATIDEIMAAPRMAVKIGQAQNSWYMLHLEREKHRLGYERTMNDMKGRLRQIVEGG